MSAPQILAALAAVAVAGLALRHRKRLGRERMALALLAAVALAVYASGLTGQLPNAKQLIEDAARALGPWTYALVGALAFLETGAFVGLVAPGEAAVLAGGVVAGQGEVDLLVLIAIVWTCAALGDSVSFFIGRRVGRRVLLRTGRPLGITDERLAQVERLFERHGGKTILIGRFIGLVRALAPFIAGSSGLAYRRFVPYSVLGAGAWSGLFCVLGYLFYRSFDKVAGIAGQATFVFGVLVTVVGGTVYAVRRLRDPKDRRRFQGWVERQGRKPVLRPLFAVARPLWRRALRPLWSLAAPRLRFLAHRVTPGGLGLELTTALAAAVGGLYLFAVLAATVYDHPDALPLDRTVLQVGRDLRTTPLVDLAKVVTDLGALPAAGTVVAATAGVLAARRRWADMAALVIGAVLVYLAVDMAKSGIDRPRPALGLTEVSGSAYPSGHASYSTAWVASAVALTRVLSGRVREAFLVLAGIAVAAVVGVTRVYLGVHFPSDVLGGWALGTGLFSACAVIALVVEHVRKNGSRARRGSAAQRS